MKNFCLLTILALFLSFAQAANVIPPQEAQTVAQNFMSERCGSDRFTSSDFTLQYTETDKNGEAVYYRFQIGEKGFILISATDLVAPVLAYSLESDYYGNETATYMFKKYKEEIEHVKLNPQTAIAEAAKEWKHYSNKNFRASERKAGNAVEPLVTTKWDQGKFYNQYCPFDNDAPLSTQDYRVPVGCVALTMINILNYHRYPSSGVGGASYQAYSRDEETGEILKDYGRLSANFGQSSYNYDAMSDRLTSYEGEFGKLVYHCGIAVRMNYAADGSGAQSTEALAKLKDNFRFSSNASMRDRSAYTTYQEWIDEVLKPELDARRPLYYSGRSTTYGGHAWIIDGYIDTDDATYFHVNWGWGGLDNGFYLIDRLTSTSMGSFSNYESAMVNLYPADSNAVIKPAESFTRNTASIGSINDGAGNRKYAKNSNRRWMIAAPNAQSYTFEFAKIKTEENHDYITIYNGPTEESGIKVRYSGNYLMAAANDYASSSGIRADYTGTALPGSVTVTADSVLVVFTSDDNDVVDYGFHINYHANFAADPNTCSESSPISYSTVGVISNKKDPSIAGLYRPNTTCQWRIHPTFISGFAFAFTQFDLKAGDFVDVYDNSNQSKPVLLHRFDINNPPTTAYNISNTNIMVRYGADNWVEGEGFQLHYYAILGVEDLTGLNEVSLFPNPATNMVNVRIETETADQIDFQLMDMTGRMIRRENVQHAGGTYNYQTSVENLSSGIYLMRIQTSKGQVTRKFIVE